MQLPPDEVSQCPGVCAELQYSTVQYSTVQYSTVQYSTMQLPPDEVSQCPGVCSELPGDPLLRLAKTRVRHTGDCSHKHTNYFQTK